MHIQRRFLAVLQLLAATSYTFAEARHLHHLGKASRAASNHVKRVAVIGAGAAGSSASYHLRQYADAHNIALNITLFERNGYIGGRSTTVAPHNDSSLTPVELGASIFVGVNYVLQDVAAALGLELKEPYKFRADKPVMGIYDGEKFVVTAEKSGLWDNMKMLLRYGMAPIKANSLMKETVGKFLKIYEEPNFPFPSLTKRVYDLGLREACGVTGEQFLAEKGIGEKFAREVIQAMTRVNYAQNLPVIHGLETMCSIATNGAVAVDGGNWRLFSQMAKASAADVQLETSVTLLERHGDSTYTVTSKSDKDSAESREKYDTIILAAPYQYAELEISPKPRIIPDKIPYVDLHVTLFTSCHYLVPQAFGLADSQKVPQMLLTTLQDGETPGPNATYDAKAGFFSISLLGTRLNRHRGEDEYLYKIFSPHEIQDDFLAKILGLPSTSAIGTSRSDDVSWVYRKLWQSYPYEFPRVTFEELRLDENLWYTSGIESFISTMETSALMGKNVARLVVDEWISQGYKNVPAEDFVNEMEEMQQQLEVEL